MPSAPRIEVILTSLRAEGTPRLTLEMCRIWLASGIDVGITVLFPEPADLKQEFEKGGVQLNFLELPKGIFARWMALAAAMRMLRRTHPGAAVISMPFGWHAFSFMGARLAGRGATVVHVGNHPKPATGNGRRWFAFRSLVALGRPFTRHYVCCSGHVAEGARRVFGLRGPKVSVVPNGVKVPALALARAPASVVLRIGMVATLEAHKDHATLLRAIPVLKAGLAGTGLTPRLILAGSGSLEGELRKLSRDLGIDNDVEFRGTVKDVGALLETLDLFVFSTTEAEGQGIALLEAMAAGLPIVASNVGACREVLEKGRAGLLCAPSDPVALAGAIARVVADLEATRARREFAYAKVEREFNVARTAAVYASLAGLGTGHA